MTVVRDDAPVSAAAFLPWTGSTDPGTGSAAGSRRASRTRITVAALGLALTGAGLATGAPFLTLSGVVLGVASVLLRRLALDLGLLAGALLALTVATAVGLLAAEVHIDLLARPAAVVAVLLLGGAGAVLDAARPGSRSASARVAVPHAWIAFVPAGAAVVIAAVQGGTSRTATSWAFNGTDLAQHMIMLKQVQLSGALDYAVDVYPRGLHLLLAVVAAPAAAGESATGLLTLDLQLVAAATWLAFALVLVAAAAVALRLGPLLGAGTTMSVGAATAGAAGLLLLNPFVLSHVYMGAAPSLAAIVALWALPLAALEQDRVGTTRLLPLVLLACGLVILLANLWQALVVVPPVAVLVAVVGRRRRNRAGRAWSVPSPGVALVLLAVGLATAGLAAPALLGVLRGGGLSLAAIPGQIPAVPVSLLVLGLGALGWSIRFRQHLAVRVLLGMSVGLVLVAGVLMRGTGRVDLSQYYVQKPLWCLTVLLVPLLAVALVRLTWWVLRTASGWIGRLGSWARVARVGAVACVVAAVVSFVLPIEAVDGSAALDTVTHPSGRSDSGRIYDIAVGYASAYRPAVTVPVEVGTGEFLDPLTTKVVAKLMTFQTGQPVNRGLPLDVCSDVRAVAGSSTAVVVTSLEPAVLQEVMRRQGCSEVPVVRLPGPHRRLAFPLEPRASATPGG